MAINKQPSGKPSSNKKTNDLSKVRSIINAMQFLKIEAEKSNNEDISLIITSAFNLCVYTYSKTLDEDMNAKDENKTTLN